MTHRSTKFFLTVLALTAIASNFPKAFAENYMMGGKMITEKEAQSAQLVKQSMTDLEAGKVAQALSEAEEAKSKAPNFYYAVAALAVCQARAGRSDEAIANFRQALSINPDLPDSLWSLAATLQSAGRTEEAIGVFRQFITKYPNDSKTSQGIAFISMMGGQAKNDKAIHHSAQDYFDEAIGTNLMRWSDKDIPVKIFIASGNNVRGYQSSYAESLSNALKAWEEASQGKIKFKQVDSADKASIDFIWSDNPKDVSNPAEGGEAYLRPVGNALGAVRIVVLTVKVQKELKLNDQLIRLICTHELGHALGIAGHSPSPGDIMYSSLPLDYERLKVSERDAKTLRKLYAVDLATVPHSSLTSQGLLSHSDIVNNDELVAITHSATEAMNAKEYDKAVEILKAGTEKYPDSLSLKRNLAAALNNSGLTAMNAQQFDKALKIFQQALTMNPDSKPAKNNITVLHYNIGLNAMRAAKFSEAEPSLKLAVEQCESYGNQPLLLKAAAEYATALKKLGKADQAKIVEAKYKVSAYD
jgi:tetratricopeptide (TPR) repeat protein